MPVATAMGSVTRGVTKAAAISQARVRGKGEPGGGACGGQGARRNAAITAGSGSDRGEERFSTDAQVKVAASSQRRRSAASRGQRHHAPASSRYGPAASRAPTAFWAVGVSGQVVATENGSTNRVAGRR